MNRLKELRNEFKYTVRDVEELTGYSNASISFYETESRNMNASIMLTFANLYHVTVDYLLNNSPLGVYVYYKTNEQQYMLDEYHFKKYLKDGFITYLNNKRYIDLNKKMQLDNSLDVSVLLNRFLEKEQLESLVDGDSCNLKVPVSRFDVIEKIIRLDDEKLEAIRNMLKVL